MPLEERLEQLKLAGVFEYKNQQPIAQSTNQTGTREFRHYMLTEMGENFMRACSPETENEDDANGAKADADIAQVLTLDEARRIAVNVAKLPVLLGVK